MGSHLTTILPVVSAAVVPAGVSGAGQPSWTGPGKLTALAGGGEGTCGAHSSGGVGSHGRGSSSGGARVA